MSFRFKTQNSIIVDTNLFFVGTATYDKTTTPSNQTKITASNAGSSDSFGNDIAVGNGKIVVGAPNEDTVPYLNNGSAYIYDLDGTNEIKINPSDAKSSANFGWSVSVGSNRIVVGAYNDKSDSTASSRERGAAYIFDLSGNQLAKIYPIDLNGIQYDTNYGTSVAVGNGRIIVGCPGDLTNGSRSGSAYIYDLDGNQLSKITASDGAADDEFGRVLAVGCGRIVVGAYGANGGVTNSGAAYLYDLDGNLIKKLTASDGANGDFFGYSVEVGDGRIVVGAQRDHIGAIADQGSAYIYDLNGNNEVQITASDGAANDYFGSSVAVGSGRIVVGAYLDDDLATDSGSIYIFDLDGTQIDKISAGDSNPTSDYFGGNVAIGSGKILAASTRDDDGGSNAGAVYVYDTPKQIHYLDQLEGR